MTDNNSAAATSAIITSRPHFLDKYIESALTLHGYSLDRADGVPSLAVHLADGSGLSDAAASAAALTVLIPRDVTVDAGAIRRQRPDATIIRLPLVVGTGMTGLLIDIAAMISRGTMFHVKGNEARVSVVHALDVARLAVELAGNGGDFTISDGTDPLWHDLVEAISSRVGHKRIITISPRWARWAAMIGPVIGGPSRGMLSAITADELVIPTEFPTSRPMINVVDYLSTHIYDENDI